MGNNKVFNKENKLNKIAFKEKEKSSVVTPVKNIPYEEIISIVQNYLSENYSSSMEETRIIPDEIIGYINHFLRKKNLGVNNIPVNKLSEMIFQEISGYSFLSKYLKDMEVEEINVNAYNNIKIRKTDGKTYSIPEKFFSPNHAKNIVRKILQYSKMVIDKNDPLVRGHIENKETKSKNVRITAAGEPVIDNNVGIIASIRKVNPKRLKKQDFINKGTATEEMLDFLSMCISYGVSMAIAGATNSGKTTLMNYVLSEIPDNQRIITIENEVREFDLIKMDKDNNVLNNAIHFKTKRRTDESKSIDQLKLLEYSLTLNPDVIVVAEAKSEETFAAQEAARTGHAVVTTVHANSASAVHNRLMTLCKQGVDIDMDTLYFLVTEAFPIVVYEREFKDTGDRKIVQIGEIVNPGDKKIKTLYEYDNKQKKFVKKNEISEGLRNFLTERGVSENELRRFA
ncbi:MAG: type II/IV secretion system ATPase subunit [Clostridiales Family XIII bacterium]|jgi:pilus assembly protein CpaF|nr:type II/IV secretion system ATPase subunit [Clostridiales Family XIII bacterium]